MKQLTRKEIIVLLKRLVEVNRVTEQVYRRGTGEDDERWANYYQGYADAAHSILDYITIAGYGHKIFDILTDKDTEVEK